PSLSAAPGERLCTAWSRELRASTRPSDATTAAFADPVPRSMPRKATQRPIAECAGAARARPAFGARPVRRTPPRYRVVRTPGSVLERLARTDDVAFRIPVSRPVPRTLAVHAARGADVRRCTQPATGGPRWFT